MAKDSEVPPAPAWKLNPSVTMPASSQKRAVSSAMSRRSGDLVIWVVPETIEMPIRYALSNNIGLGGHNGAIIFKRWDGR